MYNFFREDCDRYIPVSEDDIKRIENTLGIVFPDVLRKYYLEHIRTNLIPLAINEGGDIYYWDTNDGKVYISFNADEDENGMEIPYYVCSSVDEMFRLMNEAYEKKMRIN